MRILVQVFTPDMVQTNAEVKPWATLQNPPAIHIHIIFIIRISDVIVNVFVDCKARNNRSSHKWNGEQSGESGIHFSLPMKNGRTFRPVIGSSLAAYTINWSIRDPSVKPKVSAGLIGCVCLVDRYRGTQPKPAPS
jgi:hypothetical protein